MAALPSFALAALIAAGGSVSLPMPPPPALKKAPVVKLLRTVVLDVQVVGDVPDRGRIAFDQALNAELRKLEGLSILTAAEIREIMSIERTKQLLGCSEESSACLAELAGALDVSESLAGQLSLTGTKYTLTLRRTDLQRAQVHSKTRTFEKRDGEELLAVVGPLVEELYPDRSLLPGKSRGVSAEVVRRLNPPPVPKWALFGTAGAAVVAGLGGGAFGLLSRQAELQYNGLAERSVTAPVEGAQLAAFRQQALGQATIANALFIAAGACAVGAAIEAVFTDWNDDAAATARPSGHLSFAPTHGGAAAAFQLSF